MQSPPTAAMNSYQGKPSIHGRRAVSIMVYNAGQSCLAVGQYQSARPRPAQATDWAQVMPPSPAPTMKKNSHQQLLRRNLVNTQQCDKENSHGNFTGHVAGAVNAHELVRNNNPSLQGWKEATGHSTGHQ